MSNAYGLVEIVFSFGVILAILIWQLIVTRRSIREDRDRARREALGEAPTPTDRSGRTGDKL
jgi:hypothetical protein